MEHMKCENCNETNIEVKEIDKLNLCGYCYNLYSEEKNVDTRQTD